jgi:ribosomal protein S18 acetylase RimI-like enzyme
VRPVRESELDQLAALDHAVFGELAYPYFVLRQLFDVHGADVLVADQDGTLAGYAVFGTAPDRHRSWLLALGVAPPARSAGHARRLLAAGIERLAGAGVAELLLSVDPGNRPALGLYRSSGFDAVEVRQEYFGRDGDRLIMRLPLAAPAAPVRP